MDSHASLTLGQRLALVLTAGAAYAIGFWPTWYVRDAVLSAFGMPAYEGVWILIPHVFLYSTLSAVFCLIAWLALQRAKWLPAPSFALSGRVLAWGVAGGVLALVMTLGLVLGTGGQTHAPHIDPWLMGANLFSNFFEEFIFRGFILVALTAALGFWPAALLSSIAFGATHTQYPVELQALIATIGVIWALGARYAKSLLAPYLSHMLLDWVVDPIL